MKSRCGRALVTTAGLLMMALGLPTPASAEGLPLIRRTAEAPVACQDPPAASEPLTAGNGVQDKCVAGQIRKVRGNLRGCPTDPRALDPEGQIQRYRRGDCKGLVSRQVEAVAQSRYIAQRNQALGNGAGEIGPDLQWEVVLPGVGEIDALEYSHLISTAPVRLVELKMGKPGSAAEARAVKRIGDYVEGFIATTSRDVEVEPFPSVDGAPAYVDTFIYEERCGTSVTYRAESTRDGVIMVHELDPATIPPRAGQVTLDDETTIDCPVPAVLPEWSEPGSDDGAGGSSGCGPSPEEFRQAAEDFSAFLEDAPQVTAAFVRDPAVHHAAYFDKHLEGQKLAEEWGGLGCDGAGASPPPGGHGDPHLVTLDGAAYDFQSVGEFVLVDAPEVDLKVQARLTPWDHFMGRHTASVIDRIAFDLNGFRVEMDSERNVWVDGSPVTIEEDQYLYFNGGSWIQNVRQKYRVLFPAVDGKRVLLRWSPHTIKLRVPDGIATDGLLGNNDGDPANDLTSADGTPAPPLRGVSTYLHTRFAQSWRISQAESLFTYRPGQDSSTFTDVTFPERHVDIRDFPTEEVADAEYDCREVDAGSARDGCVLDVLITGGTTFLDDALAHGSASVSATPANFNDAGSISVNFDDTVPVNFLSERRGHERTLGAFAGPYKSGGEYSFAIPVHHAHRSIDIAFDMVVLGALSQARDRSVALTAAGSEDVIRITAAGALAERGSVTKVESGVLSDGRPFTRYKYAATTGSVGRTLRVSATALGFSRLQHDSVAIDNVALQLGDAILSTDQTIAIGEIIKPDPAGDIGVLEHPGDRESYLFTVPEGSGPLWLEQFMRPGFDYGCGNWQLVELSTFTIHDGCFTETTLPAGAYRLEVSGSDGAEYPARYGFHLHTRLQPQILLTTVGEAPVEFAPGEATPGAGVIEGQDAYDIYELDIERAGDLQIRIECLDADDANCVTPFVTGAEPSLHRTTSVKVTPGTRTLTLHSTPGHHRYKLTMWVAQETTHPLSFGDVIEPQETSDMGRLTDTDIMDRYTINVPVGGRRVSIGMLPQYPQWSTDPHSPVYLQQVCKLWRLYPAGDSQTRTRNGACLTGQWLEEGTYTLEVLPPPREALPFEYGFEVYLADETQTQQFTYDLPGHSTLEIAPDQVTGEGILQGLAAQDIYRLTTSQSGRLNTQITCEDAVCPTVTSVVRRHETYTESLDPRWADLRAGETYDVTITGGVGGMHGYGVLFGVTESFAYQLGQTVTPGSHGSGSGSWEAAGEPDRYRFTVPSKGARVALQASEGLDSKLAVVDHNGDRVIDWWYGAPQFLEAGSYEIVATAYWEGGDYSFRLKTAEEPHTLPLTLGAGSAPLLHSATLPDNAATHDYTFTVQDPGAYTLDLIGDAVGLDVIEAPDGNTWIPFSDPQFGLAQGDYRIRVTSPGTPSFDSWSYEIGLRKAPAIDSMDYTIGDTIRPNQTNGLGRLSDFSALDRLHFNVPVSDRPLTLILRNVDQPCNLRLDLVDASGEWHWLDCNNLEGGLHLPPGDYTLTIGWNDRAMAIREYSLTIAEPVTTRVTPIVVGPDFLEKAATPSGALEAHAAVHSYTFDIREEESLLAQYLEIEPVEGCQAFTVYQGEDVLGASTDGCKGWTGWVQPGPYRLDVTGAQSEDYEFSVYLTDNPTWHGSGES